MLRPVTHQSKIAEIQDSDVSLLFESQTDACAEHCLVNFFLQMQSNSK